MGHRFVTKAKDARPSQWDEREWEPDQEWADEERDYWRRLAQDRGRLGAFQCA
jgi:hypothetical protein